MIRGYIKYALLWFLLPTGLVAGLGFVCSLIGKQVLVEIDDLTQSALRHGSLFVAAKKLFAYEKHSYAESITFYVFVVPIAGANLLAVLHGIAAEGHSRAISVPMVNFVLSESLLHDIYDLRV
ncbi:hypothetical protein M1O29_00330 [Dehalococcoidia bacterium]|nr:hypothetical protein [Dehalococcoidia bacterium]